MRSYSDENIFRRKDMKQSYDFIAANPETTSRKLADALGVPQHRACCILAYLERTRKIERTGVINHGVAYSVSPPKG